MATTAISSTGNQVAPVDNFNPAHAQSKVKKCSKFFIIVGWLCIILGGINVVCNSIFLLFFSGSWPISYPDIDGQWIDLSIRSNDLMVFALIKIVTGALIIWIGKLYHKTFKPIQKEYRDAEAGITQGILMNKRHSKRMAHLKKKLWKITGLLAVVSLFGFLYYKGFQDNLTTQWLDQKYEYVREHNMTDDGTPYSVDKMQRQVYNSTAPMIE